MDFLTPTTWADAFSSRYGTGFIWPPLGWSNCSIFARISATRLAGAAKMIWLNRGTGNSSSLPTNPDSGGNPASETAATRNSTPGMPCRGRAAMRSLRSPALPRWRRIRSASRNSAAPANVLCTR